MELSQWFRIQLQSSSDAFLWSVSQIPEERREITPPRPFGEWTIARHIFHMLYYEREAALPHMQHWFDSNNHLTHLFEQYGEDDAWLTNDHSTETLLEEFQQVRIAEIALLSAFNEQAWQEIRPSGWGDQNMQWIVTKTFQHTADHINTLLQMALYWDMVVIREQEKQKG